jgi:hypothetical protein
LKGVVQIRLRHSAPLGEGASVANLKPARSFARDDNFAVLRAQFDLANVTASGIDLLRDQRRALETTTRSALRNVFASVNANFCRRGVEVGLQHTRSTLEALSEG